MTDESVTASPPLRRFLGYWDRRPYLRFVDVDRRVVEDVGSGLRSIPQGIDELLAIDDGVGVRCGPWWYRLGPDLHGPLKRINRADELVLKGRSQQRRVRASGAVAAVDVDGARTLRLHDARVAEWGLRADVSPDGAVVVIAGCTPEGKSIADALVRRSPTEILGGQVKYTPTPWRMCRVDVETGVLTVYERVFDNVAYPAAWTRDGSVFAFGTPFDPKVIHLGRRDGTELERAEFSVKVPMPLLDAAHLDSP